MLTSGKKNEGQAKENKKIVSTLQGVVASEPGSPIAPIYKRVYDKDSDHFVVQKVDEYNLFEFIQSSKSQTDLAILQKRFLELGEVPSVDSDLGSHDMTLFPSNIHEVYNMVNDVDANFNKLPESVRNVFGNKEAYLKALLDGSYNSAIIKAFEKKDEPEKKENVNNE